MPSVLVLNYHEIISDDCIPSNKIEGAFQISESVFIAQLNLIEARKIPIISMEEWRNGKLKDGLNIILTFDDGYKSDFDIVYPILKERSLNATFFPILSFVGEKNRLDWKELNELANKGFDIGSHGVFHQNMRRIQKETCKLELELSKRIFEKKINAKIKTFAAPFGLYNRRLLKLAYSAGYKSVCSTQFKLNDHSNNFILHRWNMKQKTTLSALDRILKRERGFYQKNYLISAMKGQFSKSFGIGFMHKTMHSILKLKER